MAISIVAVTDVERTELVRLMKRTHVNRYLAFRARLVLACADDPRCRGASLQPGSDVCYSLAES